MSEYRGIKLADNVKLYKKSGEYNQAIKNSIDTFVDRLEETGHTLLSEYVKANDKVLIDFKCGHDPHWIVPNSYKNGTGCPRCGGSCPKQAEEDFMKLLEENGHMILSEYKNNKEKVLIDFNCSHDPHWITPNSYKKGASCPKCSGNCTEQAKGGFMKLLEENGHEWLEGKYVNTDSKVLIDFQCEHGPHWTSPKRYKKGEGCPRCYGNCTEQAKEELMKLIEENDHKLLGEYVNAMAKTLIDFQCGHDPHWIAPVHYKAGKGCPKCAGKCSEQAKEELINLVKENGHRLLSEYVDSKKTKVLIDFQCDHDPHWIAPYSYKTGQGCPKCAGHCPEQAKEDLLKLLEKNGHQLLSEYVRANDKVLIDFKCGHDPHWISPNGYKNGHGCLKCAGLCPEQAKEELLQLIEKNNHKLLSEYKNNRTKILIDFKCGHPAYWIMPDSYKSGAGCRKCSGNCPEQAEETLKKLVEENDHTLLSEYKGKVQKVLIDLKCGHDPHWIVPSAYRKGVGCPHCNESRGEKIIRKWLKKQGITYKTQYRFPGQPKKYDFMLPYDNLIVEVHGRQHYKFEEHFHRTQKGFLREQENDRQKQEYAENLGYKYIVVDYREGNPQLALERFVKQYTEFLGN